MILFFDGFEEFLCLIFILGSEFMATAQKVRVVRCPRCQNLLPEPSGLPVYQCGGCGIVLKGMILLLFIWLLRN